jgi:hypothetical protein
MILLDSFDSVRFDSTHEVLPQSVSSIRLIRIGSMFDSSCVRVCIDRSRFFNLRVTLRGGTCLWYNRRFLELLAETRYEAGKGKLEKLKISSRSAGAPDARANSQDDSTTHATGTQNTFLPFDFSRAKSYWRNNSQRARQPRRHLPRRSVVAPRPRC